MVSAAPSLLDPDADAPLRREPHSILGAQLPRMASHHPSPPSASPSLPSSSLSPSSSTSSSEKLAGKLKTHDARSWEYIIRSGLAGGVAGCVGKTAIAPLDRVKILFQASNPEFAKYAGTYLGVFRAFAPIYKAAGVRGLFQGHSATIARIFPYAAIKWAAYEQIHYWLMPTPESRTPWREFCAGSLAGVTSVFFTYPLELLRVRSAYMTSRPGERRIRLTDILHDIYSEGRSPLPSSSFRSSASLPSALSAPAARLSVPLLHTVPLLKFYRGFSITVLGMVPYAGTSFLVYERLRRSLRASEFARKWNKTTVDLVSGGIAGAVAQTASYPFEVVRRRMQVAGLLKPERLVGFEETCRAIWKSAGSRGFYVGLSIGYLKVVPMTAISFTTYRAAKDYLMPSQPPS